MELEPFSNKYSQVQLTREQFKQISLFLGGLYPEAPNFIIDGHKARILTLRDETIKLPDHIECCYDAPIKMPNI